MFSKIALMGNLGSEPQTRTSQSGVQMTKLNIATKRRGKDGDETQWWNVTCFRQSAEYAAKYLKVGDLVYVEGKVSLREYTDRNGVIKTSADVDADSIKGLGRRDKSEANERPARRPYKDDDDGEAVPF